MGKVATVEILRYMTDCLKAAGATGRLANQQACLLLAADEIGHRSQGLVKLETYVKDIVTGACMPNNKPKVLHETSSTAWVDAQNVLGATSGNFAMDIAIKKAKDTGVGWVSMKRANHFGFNAYWAQKAAKLGLIGMAFSNSSPLLAPPRSKKAALGSNPIAMVAPGTEGETFFLNMSTTAVSLDKIEERHQRGLPLPSGWAQGPDGKETNNAETALKTRCLMPLGGDERASGYKGFGLAAMVEIFCGICSGSSYGHHVRSWAQTTDGDPANLGQCFIVVDPTNFAPGFGDRLSECMQYWRKLESVHPNRPVLVPGDIEKKRAEEVEKAGGILYTKQQLKACAALAERLKVEPMKVDLTHEEYST